MGQAVQGELSFPLPSAPPPTELPLGLNEWKDIADCLRWRIKLMRDGKDPVPVAAAVAEVWIADLERLQKRVERWALGVEMS